MLDKIVSYDDVRPKLTNGDICLFRGSGIVSRIILWFCSLFSKFKPITFSHIGFIVTDKDRVLLCESTNLTFKQAIDENYFHRGVRLVPLSQLVIMYPGEICIRQLEIERVPEMLDNLKIYVANNLGKPYEKHLTELMNAATDNIDWYKGDDGDSLFCSELVAGLDIVWGILPFEIPADHYTPESFTDGGEVDDLMKTCSTGAKYLPRIRIK